MVKTTKEQREALKKLALRDNAALPLSKAYMQLRRNVQPGPDCIMVRWCGMWLGIETDGYTHS